MTDNAQELDDILYTLAEKSADSDSSLGYAEAYEFAQEAKQAILDWHNKQVEVVLDRLEAATPDYCKMDSYNRSFLKAMYENTIGKAIQAERAKLKEVK